MSYRSAFTLAQNAYTRFSQNYLRRFKDQIMWTVVEKARADDGGTHLYAASVDQVNHQQWFNHFEMDDTYASWFFITELHVWMCAQRVLGDPYKRRGLATRNAIITHMWRDCEIRMKKLGHMKSELKRKGILQLADHFQLMLLIYDEGFAKDDQALACALWRGIFDKKEDFVDYRHLRTLVHYMRNNVAHLEKIPLMQLFEPEVVTWKPLEESIKATNTKSRLLP